MGSAGFYFVVLLFIYFTGNNFLQPCPLQCGLQSGQAWVVVVDKTWVLVVDRMGCSFQCGLQSGQTWVVVLDRKWLISGMRSCLRIAHGITLADKDTLILPQ